LLAVNSAGAELGHRRAGLGPSAFLARAAGSVGWLIERSGGLALTEQGRAVLAALLDRQ
jgi:hypothetical protein